MAKVFLLGASALAAVAACADPTGTDGLNEGQDPNTATCRTPNDAVAQFLGFDVGAGETAASVDLYLRIPEIPGESTDQGHEDEIDLVSVSWGAVVEASGNLAEGGASARLRMTDLRTAKPRDGTSTALRDAVAAGSRFPEVQIKIHEEGAASGDYLRITLEDVIIASVTDGAGGTADPNESVTLSFGSVGWTLPAQAECGTSLDPMAEFLGLELGGGAVATGDYFLKLEGIEGESTADGHQGEIDVLSWGWTTSVEVARGTDGGTGIGVGRLDEITISKEVDSASPALRDALVDGTTTSEGVFSARRVDGAQQEELSVRLTNVVVTSVSDGGVGSAAPSEEVTLNFEKIAID